MYYESYYEYIPKKKIFFLNFYLRFLVPLKFEFGHDIYIIRKLMKNSIALGSYMLKKSIFKKKYFCLSMALMGNLPLVVHSVDDFEKSPTHGDAHPFSDTPFMLNK